MNRRGFAKRLAFLGAAAFVFDLPVVPVPEGPPAWWTFHVMVDGKDVEVFPLGHRPTEKKEHLLLFDHIISKFRPNASEKKVQEIRDALGRICMEAFAQYDMHVSLKFGEGADADL